MLSKREDYEGGDFELPGEDITPEMQEQGNLLVFPSYLVHRVTAVTAGRRDSLVHRAIGPVIR